MLLPVRIALRYIRSKRSPGVIHVISGVALVGIAIATAALVIVLSVFNGFTEVATAQFGKFDPPLLIEPLEGKTFQVDIDIQEKLKSINGIELITQRVEENALVLHGEKQMVVKIKGIDSVYRYLNHIDTMMVNGIFHTDRSHSSPLACVGLGVAYSLNLPVNMETPVVPSLCFTVPKRGKILSFDPGAALNSIEASLGSIFSVQSEIDNEYVLLPIATARELLQYNRNEVNGLEIKTAEGANIAGIKRKISRSLGEQFVVKDQFQQQEIYYNIVRSEKVGVYLILSFILFIATFNVVSSLMLLILDKQNDIAVFRSMGASRRFVRRIFFSEGMLLSLFGGLSGFLLGFLFCLGQQTFGWIKLGGENYIIDSFPIAMRGEDFIIVLILVLLIGSISVGFAAKRIK